MPRSLYDAPSCDDKDDGMEVYGDMRLDVGENLEYNVVDDDDKATMPLMRNDVPPELVSETSNHDKGNKSSMDVQDFIEERDGDINTWNTSDEEETSYKSDEEESVDDDDDE
ncbi:hypothetical protein M5689_011104 [Euphorbia peplus]|nr:hypothetical protein M5689_011104 [Euphorbia peplus]